MLHRVPTSPMWYSKTYYIIVLLLFASHSAMALLQNTPSTMVRYMPPEWAAKFLRCVPTHRLKIANLPTPLYTIQTTSRNKSNSNSNDNGNSIMEKLKALNITILMKRDDMSGGVETGGNKIRKLEFLLADALNKNYNAVVTIGGEQSNHCRATAAACRMIGIEPHLILRSRRANKVEDDRKTAERGESFGYVGNILFDRMVGSKIYTCTPGEYGRVGSKELVRRVCNDIESETNMKVYPIPVGGSNGLGSWSYIEAVNEIRDQLSDQHVDHVVFACGSGGTAAGIGLGFALSFITDVEQMPKIHAVGVCDTPEYFHNEVANIAEEMGLDISSLEADTIRICATTFGCTSRERVGICFEHAGGT